MKQKGVLVAAVFVCWCESRWLLIAVVQDPGDALVSGPGLGLSGCYGGLAALASNTTGRLRQGCLYLIRATTASGAHAQHVLFFTSPAHDHIHLESSVHQDFPQLQFQRHVQMTHPVKI